MGNQPSRAEKSHFLKKIDTDMTPTGDRSSPSANLFIRFPLCMFPPNFMKIRQLVLLLGYDIHDRQIGK